MKVVGFKTLGIQKKTCSVTQFVLQWNVSDASLKVNLASLGISPDFLWSRQVLNIHVISCNKCCLLPLISYFHGLHISVQEQSYSFCNRESQSFSVRLILKLPAYIPLAAFAHQQAKNDQTVVT